MSLEIIAVLVVLVLGFLVIATLVLVGQRRQVADSAAQGGQTIGLLRENFEGQVAHRDMQISQLRRERDEAIERQNQLSEEAGDLRTRVGALTVSLEEQERRHAERVADLNASRELLADQFKVLSVRLLAENSEEFSKKSREHLDLLLKPLNESIIQFKDKMAQDQIAMGVEIRSLKETGLKMGQDAGNLTRALKGNSQSQGAWGEMILTSILERSGLTKGNEFRIQQTHRGEDGRLRTDVEIVLPNGDVLIIDSKVSLNAFDSYINAQDDITRDASLKAHVTSLRNHIKTLTSKEYQRHAGSGLDFVFLFVPIEPAFIEALRAEPSLVDYAMSQNVVLTTPTTLMSVLRAVENVWALQKRQKNADEIADRAGKLYDKVVSFLGSMDKLDRALSASREAFDAGRGQLHVGQGNLVSQVEKLKELGARTGKSLPPNWAEPSTAPAPDSALSTSEDLMLLFSPANAEVDNAAASVEGRPPSFGENEASQRSQ